MKKPALALVALLALAAAPLRAVPPSVPALTVQGVLQSGEFLGAPGNGDTPGTDRPEPTYYLQLPAPLTKQVHPAAQLTALSAPAQGTSFIQLMVFDEEQSVARTLVGKKVRVVGTVVESEAGQHRTPAYIQVRSLSAIRDWQW